MHGLWRGTHRVDNHYKCRRLTLDQILEEGKAFELCMFPTALSLMLSIDVLVLTPSKLDRDGISTVSDAALAAPF